MKVQLVRKNKPLDSYPGEFKFTPLEKKLVDKFSMIVAYHLWKNATK